MKIFIVCSPTDNVGVNNEAEPELLEICCSGSEISVSVCFYNISCLHICSYWLSSDELSGFWAAHLSWIILRCKLGFLAYHQCTIKNCSIPCRFKTMKNWHAIYKINFKESPGVNKLLVSLFSCALTFGLGSSFFLLPDLLKSTEKGIAGCNLLKLCMLQLSFLNIVCLNCCWNTSSTCECSNPCELMSSCTAP